MKRILIILLFVISFTSFGWDLESLIRSDYDISVGVTIPPYKKINDFSDVSASKSYPPVRIQDEYLFDDGVANQWYHMDFPEDPFNGLIELYAVGQPSASTTTTLIIAGLITLLLIGCRSSFQLGSIRMNSNMW